ncbi:MAG: response regulator, partial [Oceanospirillaceae bacterium]|nr:response regulator [Oceanospirillaceae bacterium]
YIIKQLADSLSGEVVYFSSEKGGAGFELTATLLPASEQVSSKRSNYREEQLAKTLQDKAVLFAEDQLTLQVLTKGILSKAGAEVTLATNGVLAMSAFSQLRPDIVITDAMMPEMDGYELSAQLRRSGYAGPIVAVTAATIGDERDRLLEAGADVVLPKPINLEDLKLALAEWEPKQRRG